MKMKATVGTKRFHSLLLVVLSVALLIVSSSNNAVNAFVPSSIGSNAMHTISNQHPKHPSVTQLSMAKYNSMNEILALFPKEKPVLINFYDAKTENDIKSDVFRAKELLADRATLVSIKQQDYPELAKLWDADKKTPAMILFKDGQPVTRLYEETHYLEIVAKIGKFCN